LTDEITFDESLAAADCMNINEDSAALHLNIYGFNRNILDMSIFDKLYFVSHYSTKYEKSKNNQNFMP